MSYCSCWHREPWDPKGPRTQHNNLHTCSWKLTLYSSAVLTCLDHIRGNIFKESNHPFLNSLFWLICVHSAVSFLKKKKSQLDGFLEPNGLYYLSSLSKTDIKVWAGRKCSINFHKYWQFKLIRSIRIRWDDYSSEKEQLPPDAVGSSLPGRYRWDKRTAGLHLPWPDGIVHHFATLTL